MITLTILVGETYDCLRKAYGALEIVALYKQAIQRLEEVGVTPSLGLRECRKGIICNGELFGAERIDHSCSPISLEQFRLPIVLHPTLVVGCEDAGVLFPEGASWLKNPLANAVADVFRKFGFQTLASRQYQDHESYTDFLRILLGKDYVSFYEERKILTAYLKFKEI